MAKALEFFFDFVSPTAYIAQKIVPGVVARTGAELIYRPMFLGGVMQAAGNQPPGMIPAKGKYMLADLTRCAARHETPLHFNAHFPMMNTRPLCGAMIRLADQPQVQAKLFTAAWKHLWGTSETIDPGNQDAVIAALNSEGLNGEEIWSLGVEADTKAMLRANTEEAVARGAFGAPTFFVGRDMFFGHDRIDYAEEALGA